MPYYVVIGTDKPDVLQTRQAQRPSHRQYLRHHGIDNLTVVLGGPTLDSQGENMNGTVLVVEAPNLALVETFVSQDPYNHANIFEHLDIRPWKWGLGAPANED